jgi:hypothetical protein
MTTTRVLGGAGPVDPDRQASRMYSSTMLQSLSLQRSDVSSNMKSIAHT